MIPHIALLLPDDRRGWLRVHVTAELVAPDHDIVARTRSHADRGAAAALAGVALLVHAGTTLLAHPGTALLLACARTALLLRAHAGARLRAGILRLRQPHAADRRIGRNGGGNGESCRGPQDNCEYSHLFLLRRGLPGGQSPRKASVSAA